MSELVFAAAVDVAASIRRREISSVEYTRSLLDRISAHDDRYNAFLRVMEDEALSAAHGADDALANGQSLGSLHGVAFALKDIIDAKGVPTTAHSKILADNVARRDAEVTARLRASGAILIGKLATHEFALGGPCFDLPWPPARNPWDRDHFPGGSSSGSGVAVAAGFVPLALGTDTAGSVRNPASLCGIVGMKATYGRVSRQGIVPLSYSLDHIGPMTRTVADNAAMLSVIAGHDPADPASASKPVPDFSAGLDLGIDGLKVGIIRQFHTIDMAADPVVVQGIEQVLETLRNLGAEIVEIETRPVQEFAECNRIILTSEAYAVHEEWLQSRPQDYGELTRERLLVGGFLRAVDYVQATRMRARLAEEFNASIEKVDVVVTASSMDPPCRIDDSDAITRSYPRQARAPFNLTGNPALVMPCGFTDSGLPLSFQIVGKAFDEVTIYRVAKAYEDATAWTLRHPQLESD